MRTVGILLEAHAVSVLERNGRAGQASVVAFPWSPDDPAPMVNALREHLGASGAAPGGLVMIVGLAFLESAIPELPPIDDDAKRAVLWRDADRYFPIADDAAIVCVDDVAMAMPAHRLAAWTRALSDVAPVQAIVTAPQLLRTSVDGSTGGTVCLLAAGDGERGQVTFSGGRMSMVRRVPASPMTTATPAPITPVAAVRPLTRPDTAVVDDECVAPAQLLRHAPAWADAPLSAQLLDRGLEAGLRGARRRRWGASIAFAAAALVMLLASANHWRTSRLAALDARAAELSARAEPARRALARREQAAAELALLRDADARRQAPDAPLTVLAQLSRILPRDAFVQRLEWDGQVWRVEGTADNAPRLVPILDGDARFRDVRIASAGQRFLDAGRPRESFAISFRMQPLPGATARAQ